MGASQVSVFKNAGAVSDQFLGRAAERETDVHRPGEASGEFFFSNKKKGDFTCDLKVVLPFPVRNGALSLRESLIW